MDAVYGQSWRDTPGPALLLYVQLLQSLEPQRTQTAFKIGAFVSFLIYLNDKTLLIPLF